MYALTAKGMKYMDAFTIQAGLSGDVLMENAARAVADSVASRFTDRASRILVLAGQGNNGGDAVAVARWLAQKGYNSVHLYFTGSAENATEEFKRQMSILIRSYPGVEISGFQGVEKEVLGTRYDCIVDGMYGIGLNRPLSEEDTRLVKYINSKSAYRVAVDIPSGLNATSGRIMGEAIKADLTVSFGNYKTGMFFASGREYCGEVEIADIGLLPDGYKNVADKLEVLDDSFLSDNAEGSLIARPENGHKGTFGTVGIVISSKGMLGAGILAAKAAYRTGCGLVKIFCPSNCAGFFNVSIPEAVAVPYEADDVLGTVESFSDGVDVILIGPGLTENSTGSLLVRQIMTDEKPVVFDAGAINLIAKNLKAFLKRRCQCVLTPHLGEMARLCNVDIDTLARGRIGYTRGFCEKFNVSMAVKSDISLIALRDSGSGQKLYINTIGNSGLATAGSGDVLAGVVASLIAQGNTLDTSLMYGVMLHGKAAEKFARDADSKRKMMAGDIIDNLF